MKSAYTILPVLNVELFLFLAVLSSLRNYLKTISRNEPIYCYIVFLSKCLKYILTCNFRNFMSTAFCYFEDDTKQVSEIAHHLVLCT